MCFVCVEQVGADALAVGERALIWRLRTSIAVKMYDAKKQAPQLVQQGRQEPMGMVVVDKNTTAEQKKAIAQEVNAKEVVYGRMSENAELTEQHQKYQKAADRFITLLRAKDPDYKMPDQYREYYANGVDGTYQDPDYKFLGAGVDKLAFYHKETNLVFKSLFGVYDDRFGRDYIDNYQRHEQTLIAGIDEEYLKERGVRYATNYFMTVGEEKIPVIAQEYFPESDYEPYSIFDENDELHEELRKAGYKDLHGGNAFRDKRTGEIVLFDCLQITGR